MKNKIMLLALVPFIALTAGAAGFNDEMPKIPQKVETSAAQNPVSVAQPAPGVSEEGAKTSVPAEAAPGVPPTPAAVPSAPAPVAPGSIPQQPGVTVKETSMKDADGRPILDIHFDLSKMAPSSTLSYEEETQRLLAQAPKPINLYSKTGKGATLAGAIKLLCSLSEMNYLAPDEADFKDMVGFYMNENPYKILRSLSDSYGFEMEYHQGVWRFWRPNPGELFTVTYAIKYEDLTKTTITAPQLIGLGNNNSNGSSSRSASTGTSSTGSITVKEGLVAQITSILDMPSDDMHLNEIMPSEISKYRPKRPVAAVKGSAKYFPDTRTLIVRATRQQHGMIQKILKAVDVASDQIELTCQFIQLIGTDNVNKGLDLTGVGATKFSLTNIQSSPMMAFKAGSPLLYGSVLSISDLSVQLNALKDRANAKLLDRPVVVARSNHETSFKSVRRIPYSDGNTNVNGSTVSSVSSTDFLEVGTVIRVRPRVLEPDSNTGVGVKKIRLDCSIVYSNEDGTRDLPNNGDIPVVNEKAYETTVDIPDGYSIMFSGFRGSKEEISKKGVWLLSDIPWLGENVFTSTSTKKEETSLYAYITARIIDVNDFSKGELKRALTEEDALNDIEDRFDGFAKRDTSASRRKGGRPVETVSGPGSPSAPAVVPMYIETRETVRFSPADTGASETVRETKTPVAQPPLESPVAAPATKQEPRRENSEEVMTVII